MFKKIQNRGCVVIEVKLREIKKDLSIKEQKVATYILENTQALKNMSIQMLAKLNHVSTSTILRLCNKLGYNGFSDFKIDLISSTSQKITNEVLQDDINLHDSIAEVNQKVQAMEKSSIDETHSIIKLEEFNKAIDLIIKSNKIIIFGVSDSGLIGKELEYQLIKIKKDVSCHLDYHIQRSIASTLDANDLIIIISHSGETDECVDLLKLGKKYHIPSVAITKMGQSRVAILADVVLHTISTEPVSRLVPIRSKMSQLSIINMLVTNIFIQQYDERLQLKMQNRHELKYPHK